MANKKEKAKNEVNFIPLLRNQIIDLPTDQLAHRLSVPFELASWLKDIIWVHMRLKVAPSLCVYENRYNERIKKELDEYYKTEEQQKQTKGAFV